ncbi:MAG: hypothetical protein A2591_02960 [Candidatus Yonathbacteria bacterium RIFOXYD1_FULL_52_36]|uniref:Uncharacterized protein n=1 Tax=Candidatus Yonathbacteria bacterium RIFOXYD1_FULL_52_36 TaxID=1802730 RepID=A0A1G2SK82_9BACT|nr:MAG: hypothetical protein A2591_02960 [Candidatus Yonathbacteria bacterium RIFOXYD1_FULL_52_36]
MSIQDCIRNAVLKEIKRGGHLLQIWLTPDDAERTAIDALVKIGIITIKDLREAAGEQWKRVGRFSYEVHRRLGGELCHLNWNLPNGGDETFLAALAYALAHGVFTDEEESRIKFGNGDTKDSFIARHNTGTLCQRTVDGWLTKPARRARSASTAR